VNEDLGAVHLRTGQEMVIRLVQTPGHTYREKILSYLAPTDEVWRWHLGLAFNEELDELETRFYLGMVDGNIVGNITTWEYRSLGILGHVFTTQEQRRKGVFKALLRVCTHDFRRRRGNCLILGTPVDAPWNHIYKDQGFRTVAEGSEVMRLEITPDFQEKHFQPGKTYVREPRWCDWPAVSILHSIRSGSCVRSVAHGIYGPFDYEDYFLYDMKRRLEGRCQTRALLTVNESVVGYASLSFDERFDDEGAWLLDLFVHPSFGSQASSVLGSMRWPNEKVRCYSEKDATDKVTALSSQGFKQEKALLELRDKTGKTTDVLVMTRFG